MGHRFSEKRQNMALISERLALDIIALVRQRYQALGEALGEPSAQRCSDHLDTPSALHGDLQLLIGVANGAYHRTDDMVRRVDLSLSRLLNLLWGNALHHKSAIPDDFWDTDIGILVSRARWWISSDDLISISNAAALAFGENTQASRMRIARAIDQGLLDWIPDPSVANPQQRRRVLRPQVERLRDQRRLPD
jgi:hypothetical protein